MPSKGRVKALNALLTHNKLFSCVLSEFKKFRFKWSVLKNSLHSNAIEVAVLSLASVCGTTVKLSVRVLQRIVGIQ